MAPGIPPTLHAHPVWGAYLAKRSQLVADLADQVHDHACQGDASQPGLQREVTRAQHLSVESQCGGPPTASIPKTRDQPAEPNSKPSRPCGNNASTGISRVPPTRQQMQGATSDRQHAPHQAATTTANACTKDPNGDRAGRPPPADNTHRGRQIAALGTCGCRPRGDGRTGISTAHLVRAHLVRASFTYQQSPSNQL